MSSASLIILLMTLNASALTSLVFGFGICLLSWARRNRSHIHTPAVLPLRLSQPVTPLPQPRLPAARHLARRPLQVVHLAVPLLLSALSLAMPHGAPLSIVMIPRMQYIRHLALCLMRRTKMNISTSDYSTPNSKLHKNSRINNTRQSFVALHLLPYGPFPIPSGGNADARARGSHPHWIRSRRSNCLHRPPNRLSVSSAV
jgi:hypothetical protein